MRSPVALAVLLAAAGATVGAQVANTFEVYSLKRSLPGTRFSSTTDCAQFRATAHTLMVLIMSAYPEIEVQPWRLSGGPSWLTGDLWDLTAKMPPGMPTNEQQLYSRTEEMLRTLLAEEFKLKPHRETRDFPVYALVQARNGPQLKPSQAREFYVKTGRGRLEFRHQSMAGFVRFLYRARAPYQDAADRPVIDKTGLDGFYDFTVEWTPETAQPDQPQQRPPSSLLLSNSSA